VNQPSPPTPIEDVRTGLTAEAIRRSVVDHLFYVQGRFPDVATTNDWYLALAYAIRDRLMQRWLHAAQMYLRRQSRTVCYLSAEFLLGPHLGNTLLQIGIEEPTREALASLGLDLDVLLEQEEEPGLGNGGLGRLAACYMESLATLDIPAIGYGIRYEFGIFDQRIVDGWQVETSDTWLRLGNPWEIARPEIGFAVGLGGRTVHGRDEAGRFHVEWIPDRVVRGVAHDTPILGHGTSTASLLRLWKSEARDSFDLATFNAGDYAGAVRDKVTSENITKVLYPPDDSLAGKELRLTQQYFFVSCSLQDMIRLHLQRAPNLDTFHEKFAAQLNDTHPALAVAELMRLLVDVHGYGWEQAWEITRRTFAYTNHTLLAEALERWPVPLFASLLPRHLEIVYEINARFMDEVKRAFPGDAARLARLSIIDESGPRYVRMAHLACVGSHTVNGVAALHSELLRSTALADFHALWPDKIQNVTNGITPRRFLALSNRPLRELITEAIGNRWIRDAEELAGLERFADDAAFQERWLAARRTNKEVFVRLLEERTGIRADPAALLDVQVKRIHEYKRQHLNVLHAITLYLRLRRDPSHATTPRTIVLGGKAAPGYWMAKRIIKLVNAVAEVVNRDPRTNHALKIAFFPDFNVKSAQHIYPAVDLSEQISMAGKEASGTGNMKMAFNGALTIGTLDGANVEIRDAVGHENFFLFGLTEGEVRARKAAGYRPWELAERDPELRAVLDAIASGLFSPSDPRLFEAVVRSLLERDEYMLLADYRDYVETQERVATMYRDTRAWARASILNTARSGRFSSDRSIAEYARNIWRVEPVRPEPR
jgi:starch phosphorylase